MNKERITNTRQWATVVMIVAGMMLLMVPALVSAADTIRIGASISMTGKMAREGSFVKKGYDGWVE